VLVLKRGEEWDKKSLPKVPQTGGYSTSPTDVEFKGDSLDSFVRVLEAVLKQPVYNETKIDGFYSAKWQFKGGSAVADTAKYLADHGLVLATEKRKVEAVFIEK
jgi:hypothetical protein